MCINGKKKYFYHTLVILQGHFLIFTQNFSFSFLCVLRQIQKPLKEYIYEIIS